MSNTSSVTLPQVRPTTLVLAVAFLVVRSLITIPGFFIPTPDDLEVPVVVIAIAGLVAAAVAVCAWRIWYGSKLAAKVAIVLTGLDVLLTIPAFFSGVGTAMVILAAIGVILGIAAITLLRLKPTWVTLH